MNPQASSYQAYFLIGPTATGKTAIAQRLAESMGAEILSADSMLVYRGMSLGTAKPSLDERRRVRYWGVDLVDPWESFSVARFITEARRCFASARERGISIIIAGGTGLYLKALLEGLDELPDPSPAVRLRWQDVMDQKGVEGLRLALAARNQAWLESLSDPFNSRRLMRALELSESGFTEPPRSWGNRARSTAVTGLEVPREELLARIERRVRDMYESGLLEETRALVSGPLPLSLTAAGAIGYAEAIACLRGTLSRETAIQLTIQRTRQLAKRQMTWFRHQMNVFWIPTSGLALHEVAENVAVAWRQRGPQTVELG
ncbi:MAG: tRNA (adenosine(37)-N6)-dimethylallyltransferase MiaA [bacterium]